MPKFKVLGGVWGEGWKPGDNVIMDWDAARVRVEAGELELIDNDYDPVKEVEEKIARVDADEASNPTAGTAGTPAQDEPEKPRRNRRRKTVENE